MIIVQQCRIADCARRHLKAAFDPSPALSDLRIEKLSGPKFHISLIGGRIGGQIKRHNYLSL